MVDSCYTPDLIDIEDALARLLSLTPVSQATERLPLSRALDRVLADSPNAAVAVPPADNSSMDGYALHTSDLKESLKLPVSARVCAGDVATGYKQGHCVRIFTGAEIPAGCNAVVPQEQTTVVGDYVVFPETVRDGSNIRRKGQDIQVGQTVIKQGARLTPAALGVLASVGLDALEVIKPLKVAIICTGNELVEPGNQLASGQIYNSNRYLLEGMIKRLGMHPIAFPVIEDSLDATIKTLAEASLQADVIITAGGVSVGEEDHVKSAVEALGHIDLWRIKLKPGKPLAYGKVLDKPFFGLPGNPASALITFCLFARPCLLKQQGATELAPLKLQAPASFAVDKPRARVEYIRARLEDGVIKPFANQSSGVLSSAVWANGLAAVPANKTFAS
ncbi:MAG: gephyrin-like molybdotransferase Glp, partial [Pontibacterium sp.]